MKITVSKHAGFCWGVRRAMDAAVEASARFGHREKVRTLGPLIHNPQAIDHLTAMGVESVDSAERIQSGTAIVRAHGIPIQDLRMLRTSDVRIYNATCPEVGKVQSLIKRFGERGYFIILLGSSIHPEVIAHQSYASHGIVVISTLEEAKALALDRDLQILVVAQTTFDSRDFDEITTHLRRTYPKAVVKPTICRDTLERQQEATQLVERAQAVVVIGGKRSNNTLHLADLARRHGKPVQHVETAEEIDTTGFADVQQVTILAGASTPNWIVEEVVESIEEADRKRNLWRILLRFFELAQLPLSLLTVGLGWWIHWLLKLHAGWTEWVAPPCVLLGFCILAPFLDSRGVGTKGPTRKAFLVRNRRVLLGIGIGLFGAGLLLAGIGGWWASAGVLVLAAAGLSFLRPIPGGWARWSLRQLPASKDLGQALAPALLIVGVPFLHGHRIQNDQALLTGAGLAALFFALHGLRHVRDFLNDRVLGPESLPVALGTRRAKWVSWCSMGVGLACLALTVLLRG